MKYIMEEIGENRVTLYEFDDGQIDITPNDVMGREEACMTYDIVGELVDGKILLFDTNDDDEDSTEEILDYMGIEEEDDE